MTNKNINLEKIVQFIIKEENIINKKLNVKESVKNELKKYKIDKLIYNTIMEVYLKLIEDVRSDISLKNEIKDELILIINTEINKYFN